MLPDVANLAEKGFRFLVVFLAKQLAHIIVAARQVNALRPVLLALEINALRKLFQRFLVSFCLGLSQKQSSKSFVKTSSVLFGFLLGDDGVI